MEIIYTTGIISISLLVGIIIFFKWTFNFWKRKNIPFDEPKIPLGSFTDLVLKQTQPFGSQVTEFYKTAKRAGFREYGLFILWRPVYLPIDPQIIKNILSVDFHIFSDRGMYYNKQRDPLSYHLFTLDGQQWQNLRNKLTPTFTSGKMKMMIHAINQCGKHLKKAAGSLGAEPINIRELVGQFTTDVIGSCAFGLDCNSFDNPNSEFIRYSKQFFHQTAKNRIKMAFSFVFPKLSKKVGLILTDNETSQFYLGLVKETVEYREKNKIICNDFMQLLINLKNERDQEGHQFTVEEVAAQSYLFFVAGYETSSTTMMFCLFELSQNFEIQEKVREEIKTVLDKYEQKVTYEAVKELKYMGHIIEETLRKYPAVPLLIRENNADYKLPGSGNILDKGTSVLIPCMGLHYDPEYFPDPEKFNPDRFNDENKSKINPYTYLPFGEGPRNCIGLRFAIMQMKIGLIYLLQNYKFSLNEKTKIPLKMDPWNLNLNPLGGIWLNIEKIM